MRMRIREYHSLGCDAIEERSLHARVAGEADGVRAQRVDGDEDDVFGLRRGRGILRSMTADQQQKNGERRAASGERTPFCLLAARRSPLAHYVILAECSACSSR